MSKPSTSHVIVPAAWLSEEIAWTVVKLTDPLQPLSSNESEIITDACAKRQLEFKAGRHAAKTALKKLIPLFDGELLKGDYGQPIWPTGFTGSISHSQHLAISVVSSHNRYKALGIDIEQHRSIEQRDWPSFCTQQDINHLIKLAKAHSCCNITHLAALIFSIKEAILKALWPAFLIPIDFLDISLTLNLTTNTFVVAVNDSRVQTMLDNHNYSAHFSRESDYILSLFALYN
jgi:4'-phosphopantetheinyl transferase EntD